MKYDPPLHLLVPHPTAVSAAGKPLMMVACGAPIDDPRNAIDDWREASCYSCARLADSMDEKKREYIRNNARERLGRKRKTLRFDLSGPEATHKRDKP